VANESWQMEADSLKTKDQNQKKNNASSLKCEIPKFPKSFSSLLTLNSLLFSSSQACHLLLLPT
jgi:hypothetical protein